MKDKHLIVIVGPTGAGKTSVSLALAKHFASEVISSDSRQIYKDLTIGTAAITPEEQENIPHHFVGTLDIEESFNAFEYEQQALSVMEERFRHHDTLVMCGGSMMYIDAVCKGIDVMPDVDLTIREQLKKQVEERGLDVLSARLKEVDKEYYHTVDIKNPARVIHGLEVYLTTGKPISSFRNNAPKERPFKITKIGITLPREELYERINGRVDRMLDAGLLDEARHFYPYRECNALKTVGYRELFEHFDGKISLVEAIRLIKRNSRRYAKKQLTWFSKDDSTQWFSPFNIDGILTYADKVIK
ncbi:MAG: tRNA (adenosine(37)-N6)-dimethylallyltransferase MiaA [Bacteroidales bacterium]|nr:tRNA (adenosine(37)-N6)-dimethylallyltransferase MiaA [Bacteroidales bacterium]